MGKEVRPPYPPEIASQNVAYAGVEPRGFRLARHACPHDIAVWANEMLRDPYGVEEYRASVTGAVYFLRVEPHWWFGAHPDKPSHWHKGVTVYEPHPVSAIE
jgi:hypothetical protein